MLLHCYTELTSCRTAGPILGDLALCPGLCGRLGTLPGIVWETWQFVRYCKKGQVYTVKHFHMLESVGSKPNTGKWNTNSQFIKKTNKMLLNSGGKAWTVSVEVV